MNKRMDTQKLRFKYVSSALEQFRKIDIFDF